MIPKAYQGQFIGEYGLDNGDFYGSETCASDYMIAGWSLRSQKSIRLVPSSCQFIISSAA